MDALLADVTSQDTYVDGVPHATFRWLCENDPVHSAEEPGGGRGFWSITKYDDVHFTSRTTELTNGHSGGTA